MIELRFISEGRVARPQVNILLNVDAGDLLAIRKETISRVVWRIRVGTLLSLPHLQAI